AFGPFPPRLLTRHSESRRETWKPAATPRRKAKSMLVKSLCAASVASLALLASAPRPAAAAPTFLEPYGTIFSARTQVASTEDGRSKDALQAQQGKEPEHRSAILLSPFYSRSGSGGIDQSTWGGGIAYVTAANPRHPWAVNFNYLHTDLDA